MAVTAISDIFVPQVVGDLATNILFKKVPILRSGVVKNATPDVYAEGGNTVTFPYFDTTITGLVQDNPGATRTGVTPSKISMGTYTEELSSKIVSFDVDKNALMDVSGKVDLMGHVADLVAQESGVTIQDLLVLKANDTTLVHSILSESTKTLNVDAIGAAKLKRGEYADDDMPILFVHTDQAKSLLASSDFKTLSSAATTAIVKAGASIPPGAVGMVHNSWVVIMDSIRNQKTLPAISSITRSSTTATVTFASAHGLKTGDYVQIAGAEQSEYNGVQEVTYLAATTVTFTVSGSPATPATGTLTTVKNYTSLMIWPGGVGFYPKKEVTGEVKTHAGTTVITIDFDFRFTGTLYRVQPRKVVKLVTLGS